MSTAGAGIGTEFAMGAQRPASPGHWRRAAVAGLVLLGGLVVTAGLWREARLDETQRQQARFEFRVDRISAAMQARLAAHEQVLRGGAGLVAASGGVTRAQWRDYVDHLDLQRNFPGFQGVGWARYVPAAELGDFERGQRAQGLSDFAVRPTGGRPGYGPVTFLEPDNERNRRAHGFDMLSEPVRRAAMERARDSGTAALTGKLKLASEAQQSPVSGFLIYVPVYRRHVRELRTVEARRAALLGWVNSPFRVNDLLQGVMGRHREDMSLRLYDGGTATPEALMHDDGRAQPANLLPGVEPLTRVLNLPGHAWTLEFTPLRGLSGEGASPWTVDSIVAAGAASSVLLAALAWLLLARIEQSRSERLRLRHMALTDQLTGLPNRLMLQQKLAEAASRCARLRARGAVLFVDLDNFKHVNDAEGHHAGDTVLREQARRLAGTLRAGDVVARLGGDEFCIVLAAVGDAAEAERVAERVIQVVSEPVALDERQVQVGASVGIAMIEPEGTDTDALLRQADAAMYRAKSAGKQGHHFFGAELDAAAARRAAVERLARQGLRDGAFELHYQPVVDLANGRVLGAEALLRLPQDGAAPVSTAELVAVAEQCGLINALGAWVLDTACARLGAWQAAGAGGLLLAVNVSARQLHDRRFTGQLQQALQRHGVDAAGLALELTETALLADQAQAQRTMRELRALGVALVLDDFGTGYSSLSHLKDFPISRIKIDRRFVFGADGGLADAGITQAILGLGRSLGVEVVAEGIETEVQRGALREQGCRLGQGWLFGKALPAAEFERRFGAAWIAAAPA
ncbi:putative bifunctional diguanylate cyclase/phosphodiesterase [Azohydromonas aeria]|uniref:putative bifunctional diguanylate cyclase/phosphodiesterase n=1 Tax=Azohydromonas aeria TaxID=2590212 RepID=UPI0012F9B4EA|nr:EAL domain-containing protein [Azohydromonas aeria]